MLARPLRVLGTGKFLPDRCISSDQIDARLGLPAGTTLKRTGVAQRFAITHETASHMGAVAAQRALEAAGLTLDDIDVLVCGNSVGEQPIPCTAALIQRELGGVGFPCLDIDATCLSFLAGLDLISYALAAGAYERALVVSSEIASLGLDWRAPDTASLFGDGAAAAVVGRCPDGTSTILASRMETYSEGADLARIAHGGTREHFRTYNATDETGFLFQMDGPGLLRMTHQVLPRFLDRLLDQAGCTLQDVDLVVPHQVNSKAMRLVQRRLGIRDDQIMRTLRDHGNTISATLPMALHEAIAQRRVARGQRLLLIGTSAGLSIGGMVLDY